MDFPDLNIAHPFEIAIHLGAAWLAGSLIGLERSFHGRPAGFRTHALVCLASALLMLITAYQDDWYAASLTETVRTDPQRMAQGIMTGIGFLGAGVIFKEGLTVRGLTTAASIWITAAIGILYGVGFFYPAILATLAAIGTLALFRWVEGWMPNQSYALHVLRFRRASVPGDESVRAFIREHGFSIANMSYRLDDEGAVFEYRMSIRTTDPKNLVRLVEDYRAREDVLEFRVSPTGD